MLWCSSKIALCYLPTELLLLTIPVSFLLVVGVVVVVLVAAESLAS